MTTEEQLQGHFDTDDIGALLEVLRMWKDEPDRLLGVFTGGIWSLEPREAVDGLRKFSANFMVASNALGDTEDGRHFLHLHYVVNSYLDLIDMLDLERPDPTILN